MIYTDVRWKHVVIANLVLVCVYIYVIYIYIIFIIYTRYIPGIYTWYISVICHPHNMPGIYLLHNSWVCSVPFFLIMSFWYTIYHAYAGQFLVYQLYTKNVHGIYYMVYPSYILVYTKFIHSICLVYTLYILGIFIVYFWIYKVYFWYIQCIYIE